MIGGAETGRDDVLMAVFCRLKLDAVALARRRSALEALFPHNVAAQFLDLLPGSQFVQARSALAHAQLQTVKVKPDEQTQQ